MLDLLHPDYRSTRLRAPRHEPLARATDFIRPFQGWPPATHGARSQSGPASTAARIAQRVLEE